MSDKTEYSAVNGQVLDALQALARSGPAQSGALARLTLAQVRAHATALGLENAQARQQSDHTLAQAALTAALQRLHPPAEGPAP
jgi:hypothetical protein